MYNNMILIHSKFGNCSLKQLHRSHPGKERMKSLAKSHASHWPGIDEDIINYERNGHQCTVIYSAPIKHTLQSWLSTSRPVEGIYMDIAGACNGLYYFLKWPEICEILNISSATLTLKLTEMFAKFGNPNTIASDNGSHFVSAQL